jgi:hypothetical protein
MDNFDFDVKKIFPILLYNNRSEIYFMISHYQTIRMIQNKKKHFEF